MDISNSRELRIKYETLRMYENEVLCRISDPERIAKLQRHIREIKRDIRNYHHRKDNKHIIKNEGTDGFIELIELPGFIKAENQAEEYFDEYHYIPPFYSLYDCTGRPFTYWHKVIKRRGKYFIYHKIAFDV